LFERLHASVLDQTPESTVHHVIVKVSDVPLFRRYEGPRCRLLTVDDLFPGTYVQVPGRSVWLHRRRPWPPVRGWVMQQLTKLKATALLDSVTLVVDSDVVLVRPVDAARFNNGSPLVLHRRPGGIHAGMERHVRWHHLARRLLGLPPAAPPFDDYIGSPNLWMPQMVRAMIRRIEDTNGVSWERAVGSQIQVSECTLYGVFVAAQLPPAQLEFRDHWGCLEYWDESPLDRASALRLAEALSEEDVAVMISARSGTALDVRDQAIAACLDKVNR
jgi:hypothetical protein